MYSNQNFLLDVDSLTYDLYSDAHVATALGCFREPFTHNVRGCIGSKDIETYIKMSKSKKRDTRFLDRTSTHLPLVTKKINEMDFMKSRQGSRYLNFAFIYLLRSNYDFEDGDVYMSFLDDGNLASLSMCIHVSLNKDTGDIIYTV